jgi:type I restriction enzyme M protein
VSPVQALKNWQQKEPERFKKQVYNLSGLDIELQKTQTDSLQSWSVDVSGIDSNTYDLSVKNPNGGEAIIHRSPVDIMDEMIALDAESAEVLAVIRDLLGSNSERM